MDLYSRTDLKLRHSLYGTPSPALQDWTTSNLGDFTQFGYGLELVQREDGVLLILQFSQIIASYYLQLLPLGVLEEIQQKLAGH
ncbi:MAG: hypothetical protein WBB28_01295 [Crinalium sp.]